MDKVIAASLKAAEEKAQRVLGAGATSVDLSLKYRLNLLCRICFL